jgi:hypothetical protein
LRTRFSPMTARPISPISEGFMSRGSKVELTVTYPKYLTSREVGNAVL